MRVIGIARIADGDRFNDDLCPHGATTSEGPNQRDQSTRDTKHGKPPSKRDEHETRRGQYSTSRRSWLGRQAAYGPGREPCKCRQARVNFRHDPLPSPGFRPGVPGRRDRRFLRRIRCLERGIHAHRYRYLRSSVRLPAVGTAVYARLGRAGCGVRGAATIIRKLIIVVLRLAVASTALHRT